MARHVERFELKEAGWKKRVKRGEEVELPTPLSFAVIVIFCFRSPKVQKSSLEKPICYFCIYSYIY